MAKIKSYLKSIFDELISNEGLIIPDVSIINTWHNELVNWINDESICLFARKGGETRGVYIENTFNRNILTTDNTPSHWVFKTMVLEKRNPNQKDIKSLIQENNFPISFVKMKSDLHLIGKMVDPSIRSLNVKWKLAHIEKIALSRSKNKTLKDYKEHHFRFLSLDNMYLIDKNYSGIAEVNDFNEIIKEFKLTRK